MASRRATQRRTRRRGNTSGRSLGPERLEARQVLSGSPAVVEPSLVIWNGEEVKAVRDSFVVQMPESGAGAIRTLGGHSFDPPPVSAGWSIRPLGMGYFSIETPGSSAAEVKAWSERVGAVAIAPNTLLEKQAIPQRLPNDPGFLSGQQWGLNNVGRPDNEPNDADVPYVADSDIDAPEAWRIDAVNQNTGSKNIVVAVMDDGIDYTHPDLQANLWQRPANVPDSVSGRFGFDVANKDVDDPIRGYYATMPADPNDIHGTAVAGIIGAKGNNNRGYTGVNWDVSMLSANIFRSAVGGARYSTNADFVEAANRIITLRTQYGVNIAVVNASWMSVSGRDSPFGDGLMSGAVENLYKAGILFVTAAGNGYDAGQDFVGDLNDGDLAHGCPQVWPGNYYASNPQAWGNVISVGASTPADTLARFSNFSTTNVHIAAPGVNIWTTVPLRSRDQGATDYRSHESIQSDPRLVFTRFDPWSQTPQGINGGYAQLSGTSMSTAFVSGVAALAAAEYMRWTGELPSADYLRRAVVNQADAVGTLTYTETAAAKRDILGRMTPDPVNHPLHSIEGNRRLNAYNSVKWVRENLPPKVTFAIANVLEGDAGTTDVVLSARLTTAVQAPLTIYYWTEGVSNGATVGIDYVGISRPAPRTFTIPAGETAVPVRLPGLVVGDTVFEPNEQFRLKFRTMPKSEAWLGSKALVVTIINDDSSAAFPAATLDPRELRIAEGTLGSATPKIVQIPVNLDIAPSRTILVPYEVTSVANAGVPLPAGSSPATAAVDYVALAGTLRFEAGQTTASIPVRILDDKRAAGTAGEARNESFAVRLLQPNPGILKQGRSVKVITIVDDDTPTPVTPPGAPLLVLQPFGVSVARGAAAPIDVLTSSPVPPGYMVSILYRTVTGGNSGGTGVAGIDFKQVSSGRTVIAAGQSSTTITIPTYSRQNAAYPLRFFVQITGAIYTKVGSALPSDSIRLDVSGLQPVEVLIT